MLGILRNSLEFPEIPRKLGIHFARDSIAKVSSNGCMVTKEDNKKKKARLLLYGFNQDFNHNTGEYCVDNFLKGVNGVCMTMMNCGRSMIQE